MEVAPRQGLRPEAQAAGMPQHGEEAAETGDRWHPPAVPWQRRRDAREVPKHTAPGSNPSSSFWFRAAVFYLSLVFQLLLLHLRRCIVLWSLQNLDISKFSVDIIF